NKETYPVFEEVATKNHSNLILASENESPYKTDLLGDYQSSNIKGVLAVISNLKGFSITEQNIQEGLLNVVKNTGLKGRWSLLNRKPKVIADTAHNQEGLKIVLNQLKKEEYEQLHIVLGFVKD